jgi:hypothetical protein
MGKLQDAFLKQIGKYMLVETPVAQADVCLVFGCQTPARCEALANHAADLYDKGLFNLIVVSGGVPDAAGTTEAMRMRDVLVKRGVPENIIRMEEQASNTGENVRFMKALLEKEKGVGTIKSAVAIGQIHAARRFVMTLERHWPELTKMFTAPHYYDVSREDWYKDKTFREEVLNEYRKIPNYKDNDFITEIDVDAMGQKIDILKNPPYQKPASRKTPPRFGT